MFLSSTNAAQTKINPNQIDWAHAMNGTPNPSMKPLVSDAVQYVSTGGSDTNDGLSWGTAKLTLAAAYTALQTCTVTDSYYGNFTGTCGTIQMAAGTYSPSTQLTVTSPFVTIVAAEPGNAVIKYTGSSGCAIRINPNTNIGEFFGSGGISGLTIDGSLAGAGTCGLETTDASGIQIGKLGRVAIKNFNGAGSVGWLDDCVNWYNEKMTAHLSLSNNTVSWKVNPAVTCPGYPNTTFGYGEYDLAILTHSGQTAFQMTNGFLSYSLFHMTINQIDTPANANGILLQNSAAFSANVYDIEIESPGGIGTGHEVSVPAGTIDFGGIGNITQGAGSSNVYTGAHTLAPGSPQLWASLGTPDTNAAGTANTVFRLDPNGVGQARVNIIDVSAIAPASYQVNQWPTVSGTIMVPGGPQTVSLTADWTCGTGGTVADCSTAKIIGSGGGVPLTFTLPLAAQSYTLMCDGVVGQATAATANSWNLLTATNGATNVTASYNMNTAVTAMTGGATTDQGATTSTFLIGPTWTLGGTATKMHFHIWAKIEGASASGTVLSLQLVAPTVADLVTIYCGASCRIF